MESSDIAEIVFGRVMNYCKHSRDEYPLECLAYRSPDELSKFIGSYLTNEDNEIKKAIENSDQTFWKAIEEEYEKLWKEEIIRYLSDYLGDTLKSLEEAIVQNDKLDDIYKVEYLKAYDKVLYKFGDAIKHALKDSKPLSEHELYNWYKEIGDAVFSMKNYHYYEEVDYFESNYDMLNDNEKLEVLSILLDEIDAVLYDIEEEYIPELEGLTNNNS